MHEQFRNSSETQENLPMPVYYVESSDDDSVLVGINVAIKHNDDDTAVVSWFDTAHERAMVADEIRQGDDYFAFKRSDSEGGQMYKFTPMNLDIYNEKVKSELIAGKEFSSDEEMIQAFLNTAK